MNNFIGLLINDEQYELKVTITKVIKEETIEAENFAKRSKYEWFHDDTHDGTSINIEKLYFRPNYQDHCPV